MKTRLENYKLGIGGSNTYPNNPSRASTAIKKIKSSISYEDAICYMIINNRKYLN